MILRFGINCLSTFFNILKLSKTRAISKFLKITNGDLSFKSHEPNMWLMVNQAKPINSLN